MSLGNGEEVDVRSTGGRAAPRRPNDCLLIVGEESVPWDKEAEHAAERLARDLRSHFIVTSLH